MLLEQADQQTGKVNKGNSDISTTIINVPQNDAVIFVVKLDPFQGRSCY